MSSKKASQVLGQFVYSSGAAVGGPSPITPVLYVPDGRRCFLLSVLDLQWGGALLRVLAQWVDAPKAHPEMLVWTPPACYVDAKADFHPALFERYLKQRWSDCIASETRLYAAKIIVRNTLLLERELVRVIPLMPDY